MENPHFHHWLSDHPDLQNVLALSGRQAWIGGNALAGTEAISLDGLTNYRLGAEKHGTFEVVWLTEVPLHAYQGWQILLDEAVRLLKDHGKLIIRYGEEKPEFSNYWLKHLLGRHPAFDATLEYEATSDDGCFISIFQICRKYLEQYRNKDWTCGIITRGNKVDQVVDFLRSVRRQQDGRNIEILVLGPENDAYTEFEVQYLPTAQFRDEYGEISAKKNLIASKASCDNLLLTHDRYRLAPGFWEGFDLYGYDFDFLAVRQRFPDGEEFPSLCYLSGREWEWSRQVRVDDFSIYRRNQYVNGGFIVVKRHVLRLLPFNDLLLWSQAEDVEVAQHFLAHSIVPRFSDLSCAITIGIDKGHIPGFTTESGLREEEEERIRQGFDIGLPEKRADLKLAHVTNLFRVYIATKLKRTWSRDSRSASVIR